MIKMVIISEFQLFVQRSMEMAAGLKNQNEESFGELEVSKFVQEILHRKKNRS